MARTRVRWGRVGALLAGAGVALTFVASSAQAGGSAPERPSRPVHAAVRHYVVRSGDTLWSIATRLTGPESDPRPVVDALQRMNHVDGALAVGARLVVPA